MKYLIAFCAFIAICHGSLAQTADEKQLIAQLDAYVQDVLKTIDHPAVGVVIVKDGKPLFVKAYGYADREANIKADNNTAVPAALKKLNLNTCDKSVPSLSLISL